MKPTLQTVVILIIIIQATNAFPQAATRFDVLITEIFPDPIPSVSLPQHEFIELKNVSKIPLNLKNWKISDGNSIANIAVDYTLNPDSILILSNHSAVSVLKTFGNTLGVSNFPSLDNEADIIFLISPEGKSIHAVSYNKSWYQNDLKSNGGWTLEMIDTENPCSGNSNWKASADLTGGTPGRMNSIKGNNPDEMAPAVLRTYAKDSSIFIVFDESIDSLSACNTSNYLFDNTIKPKQAIPIGPLFNQVELNFGNKLPASVMYNLTIKNIADCAGNLIGIRNMVKTGLPTIADTSDIVINEILFNPIPGGFDFVELYNKSRKIIDLHHLYVANRNITGGLINLKQVSPIPYLFFPGEYLVLVGNTEWLKINYSLKNIENIIELASLPSLPDDKGTVVIANLQGTTIDELHYDSKWHFALIDDDDGVSLERIDYSADTQNKNNWTSAASTVGFATPGYQNSQFKADKQLQGIISISPKVFSPDNDGVDDFATIQYQMTTPGYVANITIFDANGLLVRYLIKNGTLAVRGNFHWDGLDDKFQKLPMGIYVVFTEVFNLEGKSKKFKNVLTLARRF
jgi:hypothetical protein